MADPAAPISGAPNSDAPNSGASPSPVAATKRGADLQNQHLRRQAMPAARPLKGEATAPGDKSISHRSMIFGALAQGETRVTGLLEGDDVLRSAAAMRALGASVERDVDSETNQSIWRVKGAPWRAPKATLYFGNAGTGARLVMGAVAGQQIAARFDGDQSLRSRPMGRILDPLAQMGAGVESKDGRLPCAVTGAPLKGISYTLPKPSAQIKSAVLLAGLGAEGQTRIYEPVLCRDHTERMLTAFGADLRIEQSEDGKGRVIVLTKSALTASDIDVPGDPSSAAFLVAAALLVEGSDVTVRNVLVNPQRAAFFDAARAMGGDIVYENERLLGGEPVADIRARASKLTGIEAPADQAAAMIDEYPILAVLAAFADGETHMPGIGELRVKESDRIAAVEAGLKANGVVCESGDDWLTVQGAKGDVPGGGVVETRHDHRIAMSFLVMGLAANKSVTIDDATMIATSFPSFEPMMTQLGGEITPGE